MFLTCSQHQCYWLKAKYRNTGPYLFPALRQELLHQSLCSYVLRVHHTACQNHLPAHSKSSHVYFSDFLPSLFPSFSPSLLSFILFLVFVLVCKCVSEHRIQDTGYFIISFLRNLWMHECVWSTWVCVLRQFVALWAMGTAPIKVLHDCYYYYSASTLSMAVSACTFCYPLHHHHHYLDTDSISQSAIGIGNEKTAALFNGGKRI